MSESRQHTTTDKYASRTPDDFKNQSNKKSDVGSRSCILGKEQAKKRLQAFSKHKKHQEIRSNSSAKASHSPTYPTKDAPPKHRNPFGKPQRVIPEIERIKLSDERTPISRNYSYNEELIHHIAADQPSFSVQKKKHHNNLHSTGLDAIKAYNDKHSSDEAPDRDFQYKLQRDDHKCDFERSNHKDRGKQKEIHNSDRSNRSSRQRSTSSGRNRRRLDYSKNYSDNSGKKQRNLTPKFSGSSVGFHNQSESNGRRSQTKREGSNISVECVDGQIKKIPLTFVKYTTTKPSLSYSVAALKDNTLGDSSQTENKFVLNENEKSSNKLISNENEKSRNKLSASENEKLNKKLISSKNEKSNNKLILNENEKSTNKSISNENEKSSNKLISNENEKSTNKSISNENEKSSNKSISNENEKSSNKLILKENEKFNKKLLKSPPKKIFTEPTPKLKAEKTQSSPDTDEYAAAWEDDTSSERRRNACLTPPSKAKIEIIPQVKAHLIDLNSFDIESLPVDEKTCEEGDKNEQVHEVFKSDNSANANTQPAVEAESDREATPPLLLKEMYSVIEEQRKLKQEKESEDAIDENNESDDSDTSSASTSSTSSSSSSSSSSSLSTESSESSPVHAPLQSEESLLEKLARIDALPNDDDLFLDINMLKSETAKVVERKQQQLKADFLSEEYDERPNPYAEMDKMYSGKMEHSYISPLTESPSTSDKKVAFLFKPTQTTPVKNTNPFSCGEISDDVDFTDRLSSTSKASCDNRSEKCDSEKYRHRSRVRLDMNRMDERINRSRSPRSVHSQGNRVTNKRARSRSTERPFSNQRSSSRDWSPRVTENNSHTRVRIFPPQRSRSRSADSIGSYDSRVFRRYNRRPSFSPSPSHSPMRRSFRKHGSRTNSPRRRSPLRSAHRYGRFNSSPSPGPPRSRMRRSYSPEDNSRRLSSPKRRLSSPMRRPFSPKRRLLSPSFRRSCSPMRRRILSPSSSPGRRNASPPGRRIASSPGRRNASPPGRRNASPPGRLNESPPPWLHGFRDVSPRLNRGYSPDSFKRPKGPRSPNSSHLRPCPRTPPLMGNDGDEWASDSPRDSFRGYPISSTVTSGVYPTYPAHTPHAEKHVGLPFYESTPPPWTAAHCEYSQYLPSYSTPPPNANFGNVMHSPKRMSLDERIGNIENGHGPSPTNQLDMQYNYYNHNTSVPPPQLQQPDGIPYNNYFNRKPPLNSNLINVDTKPLPPQLSSHNPFVRKGNVLEIVPAVVDMTTTCIPSAKEVIVKADDSPVKKFPKKSKKVQSLDYRKQYLKTRIKSWERILDINNENKTPAVVENKSILRPTIDVPEPDEKSDPKSRKIVMFADGVAPGDGTSTSCGEDDLNSPTDKIKRKRKQKRIKVEKENKENSNAEILAAIKKEATVAEEIVEVDPILYMMPPPPPPAGSPPPSAMQPALRYPRVPTFNYFHYDVQTQKMIQSLQRDQFLAFSELYKEQQLHKAGPGSYPANVLTNPNGGIHVPLAVPPPTHNLQAVGPMPPFAMGMHLHAT